MGRLNTHSRSDLMRESPKISLIAAMDRNRVIGHQGGIPWRLPADFAFFKKTTMGKPIIMGRKTWESLPGALPGRMNIVLTRNLSYSASGAKVVSSVDLALQEVADDAEEIMVIGGSQLYRLFWPQSQKIYLTHVDAEVDGDTYFPDIDESKWCVTRRTSYLADEKNAFSFEVLVYERRMISHRIS